MRVLVTGGAGFVGRHVVEQLVAGGHECVVVDAELPAAHRTRPDPLPDGVEYHHANLLDGDVVATASRGCDAICHQASMVGLGVDFGDVEAYVRENDQATARLLRSLHETGFCGRVVLASSMVVYGEGRYRCAEHGLVRPGPRRLDAIARGEFEPRCQCGAELHAEAVPEDAPTDPRNVYAATKLHQEHLLRAFAIEHPGTTVTALRYHNVYGSGMPRDTPYAGVAALFRSALERGEVPVVFEDGNQLRDFVDVRDVAAANVAALTSDTPYDGPLNIASGTPTSVGAMASALCAVFGADPPRVAGGARPGDVRHVFASPDRAVTELGFRARVTFAEGMCDFATAPLRT